ncbi:hypothetical protein H5A27_06115 [Pectobacterium brasiliense]|uniref:Uncharacterized protein n=2 Tax=Pectobacteriaceae TaxID=1903410 RepID=A0A7T0HZC5_9GAMM|nr:hypothetical protein [Pectobacterium brasiliense]RJL39360.1 hypothetical protein D5081_11485 [Pectobacterium carotovorum]MBN3056768.1 hypothetical protein [Pectobacterium brasiliense]MBN3075352.1 hypothetical protein [Pectobacterium brasiliense]MBN3083522.1 hypothetical protein [Pectobacterium brasiliense]
MGYKMAELFNKHTAPVTVTDAVTGQRITIPCEHSALVAGDFRNHLFVTAGMIRAEHDDDDKPIVTTVTTSGVSVEELEETIAALRAQIDAGAGGGADPLDKDALRDQYEELFGERAPSAAGAKTLKKAIDERLAEIAAQSAGGAGDGTNENE